MNNLKKTAGLVLLLVMAGGFISFNAQAEEGAKHGPVPFAEFDQDGSGFISEEEFNTVRAQRMAAKAAEGKKMRCAGSAPSFADVDADGDGQLSQAELGSAHKAHMEKCRAMDHGHGMGHGQGHGKGEGHCQGKSECKQMRGKNMPTFADFDTDGDGKIVEKEFNEGHAKKMSEMAAEGRQMKHAKACPGFSGIDSNDDGEISKDEFAAHHAEHHKQMHHGHGEQDQQ